MRIRSIIATGATFAAVAGSAIAFTSTAQASATTCVNETTHHYSVSAKGTVSGYTMHKVGCGKVYTETERGYSDSYTGATSTFYWIKNATVACWTKTEWRHSVSKKGTVTNTITHSGTC